VPRDADQRDTDQPDAVAKQQIGRGRNATAPHRIPLRGWFDIGLRLWKRLRSDRIGLIAAGVAFYGLLALFPGIAACVALAALWTDPAIIVSEITKIGALLPDAAATIVIDQATEVAGSQTGGLGLTAIIGFLIAFWSVSRGVRSLIDGLNIAYQEVERRSFIRLYLTTFALTLWLIIGFIMAVALATVIPAVLAYAHLGDEFEATIAQLRWVVMLVFTILGLELFYRIGPCRRAADWRWLTPGALLATALWLAGSAVFTWYVSNFTSYQESFGALGGVIILLIWLWLSAFVILFGAEVDAEIEAQTAVDSTVGPDRPIGKRGAVKADQLGSVKKP